MASRKTQHYNLSLWDETDPIQREDFNADHEAIDAAIADCTKLCFGTYIGTGLAGYANPNQLEFSFQPKILFVKSITATTVPTIMVAGTNFCHSFHGSGYSGGILTLTTGDNYISWYHNGRTFYYGGENTDAVSPSMQLNSNGEKYSYLALG